MLFYDKSLCQNGHRSTLLNRVMQISQVEKVVNYFIASTSA